MYNSAHTPYTQYEVASGHKPNHTEVGAIYPRVLGLGVGVMGNAGLCSHSAHGPFFAHFHHIHSFSPPHGDPEKAGVM